MSAARLQMTNLVTAKRNLLAKLEGIEAKLRMIEATQGKNEFNFDDSAPPAKQTISDLEKRLEVKARVAEIEGRFSDGWPASPRTWAATWSARSTPEFGTPVKGNRGESRETRSPGLSPPKEESARSFHRRASQLPLAGPPFPYREGRSVRLNGPSESGQGQNPEPVRT